MSALIVLALLVPLPAASATGGAPGVIWSGEQSSIDVRALAAAAAPILWFTRDEPVGRGTIPSPIACARPRPYAPPRARPRVVYYRVSQILRRDGSGVSPWSMTSDGQQVVELAAIRWLKLRYLFYYPDDVGLNPHRHDLEGAEVLVAVEALDHGYRARILGVTGLAHGLTWSANRLDIERSTAPSFPPRLVLPVTLLVEEGKHASCPDRTGDGVFTPGDDVNVYGNDAWGLRDDFGSGRLRGHHSAEQAKPRFPEDRVFPPLDPSSPLVTEYPAPYTWPSSAPSYDLVACLDVDISECPPKRSDLSCGEGNCLDLRHQMDSSGFGAPPEVVTDSFRNRYRVRRGIPMRPTWENSAITLSKAENWRLVFGMAFPTPSVDGWFVLRLLTAPQEGASHRSLRGLAVQYTPSASRWIDPYVQVSLQRLQREGEDRLVTYPFLETGVKFRLRVGESRVFLGFRAGIQARGLGRLRDLRLTYEIGSGAF